MAYKFLDSSLLIHTTPKQSWINDFQALLDDQFYNASDWFTVQEETPYGSFTFLEQDVRITHTINGETGLNLGDDWKTLLFKDLGHATRLGNYYYFDDNYWMVVNTEVIKNLTATVTVRRCNNFLRWIGTDGKRYTVPCILDNVIQENRNYATAGSAIVNPSGILQVTVQFNTNSNKIRPNQRFIFGNQDNWTGYQVQGGGINNFRNIRSLDNTSVGFIILSMGTNFVNYDTDDVVNGFCDAYERLYTIELPYTTINGNIGQTIPIYPVIKKQNGETVNLDVTWSTSDSSIVDVTSSGELKFNQLGSVIITCTLSGNSTVYSTLSASTISSPVNNGLRIVVSPDRNYILENQKTTYTLKLLNNDIEQPTSFVFSVLPNSIPVENYNFTVLSGTSFSVKNNSMYLLENLKVKAVSGTTETTVEIQLKGGW